MLLEKLFKISLTFSALNQGSVSAGAKKMASRAVLWYVPFSLQNVEKIMEVPPIEVQGF